MMSTILNYLRYSGIWAGIVVNPFHWQFGWKRNIDVYDNHLFDNSIHMGPIWVRVIIDDGRW
jgi:hypothetical protein